MSKKNLVICGSEHPYVNYLMENILEKKEPTIQVYLCTTWEKVVEMLQETTIHILLIEEMCLKQMGEGIHAVEQVVVLAENCEKQEESPYQFVYKYQHVDRILSEIFEDAKIFCGKREKGQQVVAVYSPIGRCGKTKFAIEMGKELAKKGKTLYLNLDSYCGHIIFQKEEGLPNLGDMLYYLKQEHTNWGLRLASMVLQEEQMDYLMPIPLSVDLKEVPIEEWQALLLWLEKESQYEHLILDIGEGVQGIFDILEACDCIYMPTLQDEDSMQKMACYERNLFLLNRTDLERKTKKVVLPENGLLEISKVLAGGGL